MRVESRGPLQVGVLFTSKPGVPGFAEENHKTGFLLTVLVHPTMMLLQSESVDTAPQWGDNSTITTGADGFECNDFLRGKL